MSMSRAHSNRTLLIAFAGIGSIGVLLLGIAMLVRALRPSDASVPAPASSGTGGVGAAGSAIPATSGKRFSLRLGQGFRFKDGVVVISKPDEHPDITFKSTKIAAAGKKDVYNVTGDFTMHGVTKQITVPVQVLGFQGDRVGFGFSTTLNRKDYGIVWNRTMDSNVMLGDDVDIDISIEAVKPKPQPAAAAAPKP